MFEGRVGVAASHSGIVTTFFVCSSSVPRGCGALGLHSGGPCAWPGRQAPMWHNPGTPIAWNGCSGLGRNAARLRHPKQFRLGSGRLRGFLTIPHVKSSTLFGSSLEWSGAAPDPLRFLVFLVRAHQDCGALGRNAGRPQHSKPLRVGLRSSAHSKK